MRQKERYVLRKPDTTRSNRKWRTDQQLPRIEEGERSPQRPLAIQMFQVSVRAPGLRVSRSQLTPDQSVTQRQERSHEPSENRLRAPHHPDDQRQGDKRAHADHIDNIQAQR